MEAHEALGRVETMHGSHAHPREGLASVAGVVVAVLAAFLAVATFLANEQVKDVITKETKGADLSAQYEVNSVKSKQTIDENDALLLRTVGTGNPKALARAEKLETLRAADSLPGSPAAGRDRRQRVRTVRIRSEAPALRDRGGRAPGRDRARRHLDPGPASLAAGRRRPGRRGGSLRTDRGPRLLNTGIGTVRRDA